jgi:deoxyribodipyrimidine photo-lyase
MEPLGLDFPWTASRHHAFILQGMADNQARARSRPVFYLPFVERAFGQGRGLLAALADHAAVVVTDDHPGFRFPALLEAGARQVRGRFEAIDGVGLFPQMVFERTYPSAYAFRRHVQNHFAEWVGRMPTEDPLRFLPDHPQPAALDRILRRWPMAAAELKNPSLLALGLPINQDVGPVPGMRGGHVAAWERMERFFLAGLPNYGEDRRHPDLEGQSGLSPWIHHGHIGTQAMVKTLLDKFGWSPDRIQSKKSKGQRHGFFDLPDDVELFLDQLLTWRELGHLTTRRDPAAGTWAGLPQWARTTLEEHAPDPRPALYSLDVLAHGQTDDPLWNAAARELRENGTLHNSLRMLWGKRVLEWTPTPQVAFETLVELNNRYALDGRDPNSDSGIGWVFGLYDRPFFERPVFGKVRCMTSRSTGKKLKLRAYLSRWGTPDDQGALSARRPT